MMLRDGARLHRLGAASEAHPMSNHHAARIGYGSLYLTPREREVLAHFRAGLTTQEGATPVGLKCDQSLSGLLTKARERNGMKTTLQLLAVHAEENAYNLLQEHQDSRRKTGSKIWKSPLKNA
jgi:hypothetical protein